MSVFRRVAIVSEGRSASQRRLREGGRYLATPRIASPERDTRHPLNRVADGALLTTLALTHHDLRKVSPVFVSHFRGALHPPTHSSRLRALLSGDKPVVMRVLATFGFGSLSGDIR